MTADPLEVEQLWLNECLGLNWQWFGSVACCRLGRGRQSVWRKGSVIRKGRKCNMRTGVDKSLRAKKNAKQYNRDELPPPLQERRENVEENGTVFEVEEKRGICFQEMIGDEMLWWGSAGVWIQQRAAVPCESPAGDLDSRRWQKCFTKCRRGSRASVLVACGSRCLQQSTHGSEQRIPTEYPSFCRHELLYLQIKASLKCYWNIIWCRG